VLSGPVSGRSGLGSSRGLGTTLDIGDPVGREYAELKRRLPWLNVMGGCCGTGHRHVEQIATACVQLFR